MDLNPRIQIRYLKKFLNILPKYLSTFDTTRITIAYFAISGLDVLNSIESIPNETKAKIINWIYSLQIIDETNHVSGFQGSSTFNILENKNSPGFYKWSHIASTYCALCSLIILGDDLSRVNKKAIINSLKVLQLENGCYTATIDGSESDMRFLYCASSICYILNDWNGMNMEKAKQFVINSLSYDYGVAQGPELEAHGGSTYCAIATLALTNQLSTLNDNQIEGLKRWLLNRQEDGFNGRPNKPVDTCYTFWVGASLKILNAYNLIDTEKLKSFVLATQDNVTGGLAKWVSHYPDPLHTYLGLAGLSLMNYNGLNEVEPTINITVRSFTFLKDLHEKWNVGEN